MLIDALTIMNGWPMLLSELNEKDIVESMAKFKVDKACLLSSKSIFFDAHSGNETVVEACKKYSDKLLPIGFIDPRVSITEEIDYCVNNSMKIFMIYPETQNWRIDSLLGKELFSKLKDMSFPLMIEASKNENIKELTEVAGDFSSPVILVDVSLKNLSEVLELAKTNSNIYLTTRTLCGADTIEMLCKQLGADRLIFSSSFPVSSFSASFLATRYAKINQNDLNAILGDNIANILRV